jgi:hypothetical protein
LMRQFLKALCDLAHDVLPTVFLVMSGLFFEFHRQRFRTATFSKFPNAVLSMRENRYLTRWVLTVQGLEKIDAAMLRRYVALLCAVNVKGTCGREGRGPAASEVTGRPRLPRQD